MTIRKATYYVIRRIAARETGHGAARQMLDWASAYLESEDIETGGLSQKVIPMM